MSKIKKPHIHIHQQYSHHSVAFKNLKGSGILLLTALIWGLAFVAQDDAANKGIMPFTFNAIRSFIGTVFMALMLLVKRVFTKKSAIPALKKDRIELLVVGVLLGLSIFLSLSCQQYGITAYPDGVAVSARCGFLSSLYVVIVPLLSPLFHRKVPFVVWIAAIIAFAGVFVMSISGNDGHFYLGDVLSLGVPFFFTFQVLLVDKFGSKYDSMLLAGFQFFFFALFSAIGMLFVELPAFSFEKIGDGMLDILYLGLLSSGIAYPLQIVGQRYASPTIASLVMSLEGVVATIGGCLIMGDVLSATEVIGCVLLFSAIVLAQLPDVFTSILAKKKKDEQPEQVEETTPIEPTQEATK